MDIVLAAGLLGADYVLIRLLMLGMRRSRRPFWGREAIVENFWCPALIGLAAFGASFLVRGAVTWRTQVFGWSEAALLLVIAAACAATAMLSRRATAPAPAPADVVPISPPTPPASAGTHVPSRAA